MDHGSKMMLYDNAVTCYLLCELLYASFTLYL